MIPKTTDATSLIVTSLFTKAMIWGAYECAKAPPEKFITLRIIFLQTFVFFVIFRLFVRT